MDYALTVESKLVTFPNAEKIFSDKNPIGTVTQQNGVRSEEDFPDQGRRETSGEAIELRVGATERRDCGVQHRARKFDLSADLQTDFAK
jgi:hypothetical protein